MNSLVEYFRNYSQSLFRELGESERLSLRLAGEESLFLRWNQGRVRQTTDVRQYEVEWIYQSQNRQLELGEQLGGDLALDVSRGRAHLERLRLEILDVPETRELAPFPPAQEIIKTAPSVVFSEKEIADRIRTSCGDLDLVGFWVSGPLIRAIAHSEGLFLFESRDLSFFDFSLFRTNTTQDGRREDKAVKGFVAGPASDTSEEMSAWKNRWDAEFKKAKEDLARLALPSRALPAGKYRVYLSPQAFGALVGFVHLGMADYKQGRSPMKDLIEGRAKLSPLLHLRENFQLGLAPRFNRFGEYTPSEIQLITGGNFQEGLVSGRTAHEYGLVSNAAEDGHWVTEVARSLEVNAGELADNEILQKLHRGLYINEVHYANLSDQKTARVTGMTRYACFWVENGEIQAPIQDLRFDVSLYQILGPQLLALTRERRDLLDTQTYHRRSWSGQRLPGLLIEDFEFTL